MKAIETIYKGVPITGIRTVEMIDTIIEKRNDMNCNDLAKLLGLESYRPLVSIITYLNKVNGTTPKKKPIKRIREAKNTYTNYDGKAKGRARRLIGDSIMLTKRQNSNILTLPAAKWEMEKNILKQKFGYKFTAVERIKETYQEMMKNLVSNPILFDSIIATANKSIREVIVNDSEDTYSSAILDYCGFIDTFHEEINDVMKRNLVKKGGYIAITLSENDRVLNHSLRMNNYSNRYIKNCYADEKPTGAKVTTDLVRNLVSNNIGYEIVTRFAYRDTKTNMLLFIIKRSDD